MTNQLQGTVTRTVEDIQVELFTFLIYKLQEQYKQLGPIGQLALISRLRDVESYISLKTLKFNHDEARLIREALGLSQSQLAIQLGMKAVYINRWEKASRPMKGKWAIIYLKWLESEKRKTTTPP